MLQLSALKVSSVLKKSFNFGLAKELEIKPLLLLAVIGETLHKGDKNWIVFQIKFIK